MKVSLLFIGITLLSSLMVAQESTLDYKIHDAGLVRLRVTNNGPLWPAVVRGGGNINCEYPPNSNEEHIGEAGIWVGGITPGGDTLVTVTSSWNPWGGHNSEFYPSSEPWDTVWVVSRGDTVDIPYWQGYVGFSDQDFVCRYSDYGAASLVVPNHKPLYIDVIQNSYSWSSQLLNEVIVFNFKVIPTRWNLKNVYITYWADPNVGNGFNRLDANSQGDDKTLYYQDLNMGVGEDGPKGGDGQSFSPIGFQMFPRLANEHLSSPDKEINWTFKYNDNPGPPGVIPEFDNEKYRDLMADGEIMQDQLQFTGSHFVLSFGPYDLSYGDTLKFRVGVVLGEGLEGLVENAQRLQKLEETDFADAAVDNEPPLPVSFKLYQNYPNPFNPVTTISFDLPEAGDVKLVIYDILGREADRLIDGFYPSGYHTIIWNASNVSSGIYLYQLTINEKPAKSFRRRVNKLVVLK